jgi:beta-mannosidase
MRYFLFLFYLTTGRQGNKRYFVELTNLSFFIAALTSFTIRVLLLITTAFLFQTCKKENVVRPKVYVVPLETVWQFRQAGAEKWLPATVPGCVHTDLLKNKKILEPYIGTNERKLNWIEREDWEYHTVFSVDSKIREADNVALIFEGLDTFASVYLNDSLVLQADNMFRSYEISCKNLLKPGKNSLRIYFKSPINTIMPIVGNYGYQLPAPNDFSLLKSAPFIRKAAYQFGSDFSPRFLTCGVWRPVYLKAYNVLKINDLQMVQEEVSDERAILTGNFEIQADKETKVTVALKSDKNLFPVSLKEVTLQPGINFVAVSCTIPKPKRWWTNGLGEAFLYKITGEISVENQLADTISQKTGIRTLEIITAKDSSGKKFEILLNGTRLFIKGCSYLPASIFPTDITNEKHRKNIQIIKDSHINMLRVRGDGIYENDSFYDSCDENGILVWQDFMFANALYPGDSNFLENVKQEVLYNVKRLRNHASVALWCGNDEVETNWYQNKWQQNQIMLFQDSLQIRKNYYDLFYKLLPEWLSQKDKRFYLPSSPSLHYTDIRSQKEGIFQYYQLFKESKSISAYSNLTGRFIGGYWFYSSPELNTVWYYLPNQEDWELNSRAIKWHSRMKEGNEMIKNYISEYYKMPNSFENYFYVSQLLQAEIVKKTIERQRRRKNYCMGTIYGLWQDCWTGLSPGATDYFDNAKALRYVLKNAYSEIMVSTVEEEEKLKIYVVSDKLQPVNAELQIRLFDFSGRKWFEETMDITMAPNSSKVYFTSSEWKKFLRGKNINQLVLQTIVISTPSKISQKAEILSENLYYLLPPRLLNLSSAKINISITEKDKGFEVKISSDKLVKNVYLRGKTLRNSYSDNFFDLLPLASKTVYVTPSSSVSLDEFKKDLKISTLADTYLGSGNKRFMP